MENEDKNTDYLKFVIVEDQKRGIADIVIGIIFFFAWDSDSLFFIKGAFKSTWKKSPPLRMSIPTQNLGLTSVPPI